nr:MAG TPA: hypothetical protein [Caudoviricetes sp.]
MRNRTPSRSKRWREGATLADYAREDLFFWLTPPAKWRRGAYAPPIDFYCPHSPRTTFVTNRP